MLLFTQYKTIHDLPLSAVSLSHCIIPAKMSVFNSHVQGSHSVISIKPRLHTKKTYLHHSAILDKKNLILITVTENVQNCECICLLWKTSEAALRIYLCLMVSKGRLLKSALFLSCVDIRIIFEV